jgi:tRNA wybutosine-synthesizing protein 2
LEDRAQHEELIGDCQDGSLTVEALGDRDNGIAFPSLRFDVASGEYVELSTSRPTGANRIEANQQHMRVPTIIPYPVLTIGSSGHADAEEMENFKSMVLENLALGELCKHISVSRHVPTTTEPLQRPNHNPVNKALEKALSSSLRCVLSSRELTVEALVTAFPDGFSVYKPLLLLPHHALSSTPWITLITTHPVNSDVMRAIWKNIAQAVGATHVALNSPIPNSTIPTSTSPAYKTSEENILRSPLHLTPLHGDFGPVPTPQTITSPTAADFANALWVTARQNGIWQTWAPRYTMFSRGNIREKARILRLPTVTSSLDVASTAVDLYAGIGYFAFSYKKSGEGLEKGIKQVLCWEINPWSVEGLRRGAEMNGWTCRVLKWEDVVRLREMQPVDCLPFQHTDFLVFQMSNESAGVDYASLPLSKLPVRHVNLGLLPSSKLSWSVAVTMLDKQRGGWIHVHENVGVQDVEAKQNEVEKHFQDLVGTIGAVQGKSVHVEHVERVKMYAPSVVHCVFDVHVEGGT